MRLILKNWVYRGGSGAYVEASARRQYRAEEVERLRAVQERGEM
jgi:hypothetical protein